MIINNKDLSIIIPAKNEGRNLEIFLPQLVKDYSDAEIIVVNDGSSDNTQTIAEQFQVRVINHPYSIGNGAAIKSGVRHASRPWLLCMDGDGQHLPINIRNLIEKAQTGYDMVVGARNRHQHANIWRFLANSFYNHFASWVTGQTIKDLTSGLRLAKRDLFTRFMHLYPNGFSSPTTSTMAFFKAGFVVGYTDIIVMGERLGKSHIKPISDGLRFLLIIFKITSLYSPLKLFTPIALMQIFLGSSYYIYTWMSYGRFTNMAAMLLLSGITTFLVGLVSEQVTTLIYKDSSY